MDAPRSRGGVSPPAPALGCLLVAIVVVLVALVVFRCATGGRDAFFTSHAREEPTRSYVPYTGAPPLGHWGTAPWAETIPLQRGGTHRCYANLYDFQAAFAPLCRGCGGTRRYHAGVQAVRPHPFVTMAETEALPDPWAAPGPYASPGLPALD